MDCPNCGKKPVGIFHTFRLNGVSFKEKFQGLFRCKHCGTLLRQKKSKTILNLSGLTYKKGFWPLYFIFSVTLIGSLWYILRYFVSSDVGFFIVAIGAMITMMGGADLLRSHYWVLERADAKEVEEEVNQKLSAMGLFLFLVLMAVAIALPLIGRFYFTGYQPNPFLFIIGTLLYLVAIIAGALYIIQKFSLDNDELIEKSD